MVRDQEDKLGFNEESNGDKLGKREFDPVKAESEGLFGKLIKNKQKNKPKNRSFGRKNYKKVKNNQQS